MLINISFRQASSVERFYDFAFRNKPIGIKMDSVTVSFTILLLVN